MEWMKSLITNIKDTLEFWSYLLPDKRLSLRYKLAIMVGGENLHTAIAFSHANAKDVLRYGEIFETREYPVKYINMKARHICEYLEDAMEGQEGY